MTIEITVQSGKVATDLSRFVTRVDLTALPSTWWQQTLLSDGGNVRIRKSGVDLPIDLTFFDPTKQLGTAYFRSDLFSGVDNVFTVEAADPGPNPKPADTDPIGRNAVWEDFDFVVMFRSLVDRTGKTAGAALVGTAALDGNGWLQCGSAGNAYVTGLPKRTTWTMGCSVIPLDTAQRTVLSYSSLTTADGDRASLVYRSSSGSWGLWNSTSGWLVAGVGAATNAVTRLHHTQDGVVSRRIFVDGVEKASSVPAQRPGGAGNTVFIGAEDTSYAERFNNKITHAYLRNGELAPAWLAAEKESWGANTFYTVTDNGVPLAPLPTFSGDSAASFRGYENIGFELPPDGQAARVYGYENFGIDLEFSDYEIPQKGWGANTTPGGTFTGSPKDRPAFFYGYENFIEGTP